MSHRLHIAIVGFGIAGASLALQLGRRDHAVECFERAAATVDTGAGLLLGPPALTVLRLLGLEDAVRQRGAVVSGLSATNADGKVLLDWDARRWGHSCLGVGIERRTLRDLLARVAAPAATLHHGIEISHVDAERGLLFGVNGERFGPFDLLLACDGAHSQLRAGFVALVARTRRYRWSALSCLMRVEQNGSGVLEQRFSGAHHASCWPVGGADADGEPAVCVSVNLPSASASELASGSDWRSVLRRAGLDWVERFDSLRPCGPWIALSCQEAVLRRYSSHRLVFVGDAAHSLSPQLGQGTRLALAGSVHLADALDRHRQLNDALVEYERRQRTLAVRYQRMSRWITPLFQSPGTLPVWLREQLMPGIARLEVIERSMLGWLCDSNEVTHQEGLDGANRGTQAMHRSPMR